MPPAISASLRFSRVSHTIWTGDRENHYWLQLAVSGIRRRHGYDLNGPIEARPGGG